MPAKQTSAHGLIKIHLIGGSLCVLIAASSIYFAGSSISLRRGLFLSARQELASTKAELNTAVKQRSDLASGVQRLERVTAENLELVPVKRLNVRTADIVALAETVSIRIDTLQPLEQIPDARVPVQPLVLMGSAHADDVSGFLGLLGEKMPDMHVQSIELGSESGEDSRVTVRMVMYWFVDPAGADH